MEQFDRFIGKVYDAATADQIADMAKQHGWRILPWPEGVSQVSYEEGCLTIYLNNDIDGIITRFQLGAGESQSA